MNRDQIEKAIAKVHADTARAVCDFLDNEENACMLNDRLDENYAAIARLKQLLVEFPAEPAPKPARHYLENREKK